MEVNSAKLAAIHLGFPIEVEWRGKKIMTGIFKKSTQAPAQVTFQGIVGDGQAEPDVHGGEFKAIYAYASEDYEWWKTKMGSSSLDYGTFGENFTIDQLSPESICVGDRFQLGPVILEASQARMPCFKLGIRMGDDSFPEEFLRANRLGIYFRVEKEGVVSIGDTFKKLSEHPSRIPVLALRKLLMTSELWNSDTRSRIKRLRDLATLDPIIQQKIKNKL